MSRPKASTRLASGGIQKIELKKNKMKRRALHGMDGIQISTQSLQASKCSHLDVTHCAPGTAGRGIAGATVTASPSATSVRTAVTASALISLVTVGCALATGDLPCWCTSSG